MGIKFVAGLGLALLLSSVSYADPTVYRGMEGAGSQIKDFKTLKAQGFLTQKPQVARVDYNDIYKLQKPLQLLGQEVSYLSLEYMDEYVGCCVSEGWGAVVKKTSHIDALQKFANAQQCTFKPFDPKQSNYYSVKINPAPKAEYFELSCRERDIQD
ncbi:hypothetical protein EC844_11550 [Acinetobacter calcoaceticus]|uniref:Uncharacterized protein n=1 Tax=Acinetobacter calcoaceticus TaxID=471 RepID=A0A4R1XPX1_ACICA|nr:hypothetical protein EC844_11550 [Acinetobacter calcoaceticus]